ncbi:MAG TPA: sporulation integral membrane protein YtvI [Pseudogracilibacillus sp.]|nr:sporulation integral membrane protein YtvI [Pseudogracilibacillus sp.]
MDNSWKGQLIRLLTVISLIGIVSFLSYISVVYFYPFLIAFIISILLQPFVSLLRKKWGIHRGLATMFAIFLFFCISMVTSFFAVKQLYEELTQLFSYVPTYVKNLHHLFYQFEQSIVLPIVERINLIFPLSIYEGTIAQFISEKIIENVTPILQQSMKITTNFLTSFVQLSLIFFFILFATYFMTKDYEKITVLLNRFIPKPITQLARNIKLATKRSVIGLVKAHFMIAFITGILTFIYLLLFRFEHPLIIAFLIIVVDLIPYVGIGLLLIPWICYLFFSGDYIETIQLTSLYIGLVILRQFIEPRLLAGNLGLHPLVTIVILFLAMKLFGAIGLLLSPILLILLSSLYHANIFHLLYKFIYAGRLS